jgi:pimeloyl-ACP methyl ester carboxylesterase
MLKRILSTLIILSVTCVAGSSIAQNAGHDTMSTAIESGYASVNGVDLYYEIHGAGSPLVLLHGGVAPAEVFGAPLVELAKTHKVIAIHLRGHGLSKDTDAPWSYEIDADDVAALLDFLKVGKATIMGYSFGARVALQTAIRHPERIDRLVAISTSFRWDGDYPEVIAAFEKMPTQAAMIAKNVAASPLAQMYPDVDWETNFRKTGELNRQHYDWVSDIPKINNPTLLIYADADSIRPEHIAEFYKLLGGGQRDAGMDGSLRSPNQLAVVPGRTHYDVMSSPAVIAAATAFLAN